MANIWTADGFFPFTADGWPGWTADGWYPNLPGGHGSGLGEGDDGEDTAEANRRKTRTILSIRRRWAQEAVSRAPVPEYVPAKEPEVLPTESAVAPVTFATVNVQPVPQKPAPVPETFKATMRKKRQDHDEDEEAAAMFMNFLMRDDW